MADEKQKITKELSVAVNALLGSINLDDVTAESTISNELPEGYYLSELKSAKLTESKSSHLPMVALQFTTVDDGKTLVVDEAGNAELNNLPKTTNKSIRIYYVLKDEKAVKRFVADMLKFEGETAGEPILGKEYFTNAELLEDALEVLEGMRVYIQISVTNNDDGTKSTWQNLISWKRAKALELDV